MNTPGYPDDDEAALHAALQQDSRRARQLPPFDPALHAATMRRVRALTNARNGSSIRAFPALIDRAASLLDVACRWRGHARWLGLAGTASVLVGFVCLCVRPSTAPKATGGLHPGTKTGYAENGGPVAVEGKSGAGPSDDPAADHGSFFPDRKHGAHFNPGEFSASQGGVRLLVAGLVGTPGSGFDLEAPGGPIRLDCGSLVPDGGTLGGLLARPTLGDGRPF